ncbi:unnamed protein product [Pocillopora meandrina]|uniref:G-protein coupled receptors family 1 profile domain-containing protein n=1 Tax=Pocillopora meandrina TaxID=46732 RepID=A0AAU9Y2Z8_9CNID|nr:unnamed protein product [Pocillopora meandrina]
MLVAFAGNGFLIYIVWKKPEPKLTVPFIWIGSLVSMSIFLVIQTVEDYNNSSYCMLSVYILGDPDRALRGIYLLLFVVNYFIPLAVISCLYTITAWNLWFHVAPGVNNLRGNRAQLETSKRRVVRMLIIVTCAFALCWLPPQVVHMMQIIHASKAYLHIQPIVSFVCFWFGHANSAVNPWLYIFLSTKINTAFTRIVSRKSSRLPSNGLWMIPGVFGKVMCKGVVYTAYVTITASVLCLTFMAIDRYYAIVHPLHRHLWFRKPKLTVPFIWIASLVSMSIFLVIQTVEDYNNSSYCMLSVYILGDPDRALRGIYVLLFVVNYLIPLAVIYFLYTITAWNLWFHVAPGVNTLRGNRAQLESSKRRVVRMLIIVTCAFALCWLPPQVVHVMTVIHASKAYLHIQPIVSFVCFWFGHANSAVNPWLYIFLSTKINTAFTRIVSRKSSRLTSSLTIKTSDAVLPPEHEAIQKESTI